MYEDRISGLQSSLKDVRESVDEKEAKMDEMSSQIREYEAALDELERDNQVQTAKIRVECEKQLQDAESKLVRIEADLLKVLYRPQTLNNRP
jgi:outer membrane murein-binding lipoprotein Lpp